MNKPGKRILVATVLVSAVSMMVVLAFPRIRDYVEARKQAQPIIEMLRQGTSIDAIGNAVNAITGNRFVTNTNVVTGNVSHYVLEKQLDFEPLSRTAAEMVQKEIVRILPSVSGTHELSSIFRAFMCFNRQGSLAMREPDWQVVEEATNRYNSQQSLNSGGFYVATDQDGKKMIRVRLSTIH